MSRTSRTDSTCNCGEDLIAYLYGEANEREAAAFEQHLKVCAACRSELAAFKDVRADVSAWHRAVLETSAPLSDLNLKPAPAVKAAQNGLDKAARRKRSAVAALREFFALSPLWLQAGSFAALALVCALGLITVTNAEVRWDGNGIAFRTGVQSARAGEKLNQSRSQNEAETAALREQVKNLTAERDALRGSLEQTKSQLDAQQDRLQTLNASLENAKNATRNAKPRVVYIQVPTSRSLRNNQRTYSAENDADERDAPRLIDLIGDSK